MRSFQERHFADEQDRQHAPSVIVTDGLIVEKSGIEIVLPESADNWGLGLLRHR
jgi:hypothetical protein